MTHFASSAKLLFIHGPAGHTSGRCSVDDEQIYHESSFSITFHLSSIQIKAATQSLQSALLHIIHRKNNQTSLKNEVLH
jgi:hypothetical protein